MRKGPVLILAIMATLLAACTGPLPPSHPPRSKDPLHQFDPPSPGVANRPYLNRP